MSKTLFFKEVNLGKISLKNPVIAASGTFGYGKEFMRFFDINRLGGLVTKTITLNPREGNKPPRIYDLGFGVVNSIGLENPGVERFKQEYIDFLSSLETRVFLSIYGKSLEEWEKLVGCLDNEGIAGFELNFSCPNVEGEIVSYNEKEMVRITSRLRKLTKKFLIIKLSFSPFLVRNVLSLQKAGADAVTLINTIPALAIERQETKFALGEVKGGLSGGCLKPIALRCVYEVSQAVTIPVIGCGGVQSYKDVVEYLFCGAKAVQVGTANLVNPQVCEEIINEGERLGWQ